MNKVILSRRKLFHIFMSALMVAGMLFPVNSIVFATQQNSQSQQSQGGNNHQGGNQQGQQGGNQQGGNPFGGSPFGGNQQGGNDGGNQQGQQGGNQQGGNPFGGSPFGGNQQGGNGGGGNQQGGNPFGGSPFGGNQQGGNDGGNHQGGNGGGGNQQGGNPFGGSPFGGNQQGGNDGGNHQGGNGGGGNQQGGNPFGGNPFGGNQQGGNDGGNHQGGNDDHHDGGNNQPGPTHEPTVDKSPDKTPDCGDKTPTPNPTTETPAPTTSTPVPTTETPAPTTETPVPTTETPVPTTETPVPTTETPVPTTETPVPTTETPVPTTETPVPTTQTPVPTTETPVPTTQTPVPTTQTPVPTTQTPNTPTGGNPPAPLTAAFVIPETGGGVPIIVAGLGHSCMTYGDGVICWGLNLSGQLGDGTNTNRLEPVTVKDLHNVIDLTAGSYHTCALTAAGEVWCWGENTSGQLGNGTTVNQSVPVMVKGLPGKVVDFTAGNDFTCAKLENNDIWCWGNNQYGQLNDGTLTNSSVPVKALFNNSQNMISGGQNNLLSDSSGNVESWQNLQTEKVNNVNLPQGISANRFAPGGCVTTISGTVKCWQNDYHSAEVSGVTSALLVGTGYQHSCTINTDLTVSCWGINSNGELGNGSTVNSDQAVVVLDLSAVQDLAVGSNHTCVLSGDGYTPMCWGENTYGQLGDNTTANSDVPVLVHLPG